MSAPNLDQLPIIKYLPQITGTIRANPATVIIGATGSGKTTQVGLHLLQQGLADQHRIGVTQPRRLAATSVAQFVSQLYGCPVGQEVGYKIRFDDSTMQGTKLKFMTDGILLQEASFDPLFSDYSILIFDEAHEQGLNTDIGLGLAKRALQQRPDLKVVIMSATIDTGRFSEYFNNAPMIQVEGRTYPILTRYLEAEEIAQTQQALHLDTPTQSLPELAAYKVKQIVTGTLPQVKPSNNSQTADSQVARGGADRATGSDDRDQQDSTNPHHILIFMPGKKEIAQTIEAISSFGLPNIDLLPAHSEMDQAEQQRILEETGQRKVIVATNIAETSITVDNLAYVIDSGLIRQMVFDHKHGISALKTIEHSKAGLKQRMGRAGRTQPGTYLPLFTEAEYESGRPQFLEPSQTRRPEYSTPEIQREDLASAVLRMTDLGITNLEQFDFLNQPPAGAIHHAIEALKVLGAINADNHITELGQQMATLPVEPRISRMILEAENFGCVEEIITISAALSTGTIFLRPIGDEIQADAARARLLDKRGDLFTLLYIIPQYESQEPDRREAWANQNYLNQHALDEILLIRDQLTSLIASLNIDLTSLAFTSANHKLPNFQEAYQRLGQAIAAGLLQNLAVKTGEREYTRANKTTLLIHPSSVWADKRPPLIVCTEILELNGYTYAVNCQAVEIPWLQKISPHLIQIHHQPLTHPWKGNIIGQYTIMTINGIEVDRKYSGHKLPHHLVAEAERKSAEPRLHQKRKKQPKHLARKRKNIGKRRQPSFKSI